MTDLDEMAKQATVIGPQPHYVIAELNGKQVVLPSAYVAGVSENSLRDIAEAVAAKVLAALKSQPEASE